MNNVKRQVWPHLVYQLEAGQSGGIVSAENSESKHETPIEISFYV